MLRNVHPVAVLFFIFHLLFSMNKWKSHAAHFTEIKGHSDADNESFEMDDFFVDHATAMKIPTKVMCLTTGDFYREGFRQNCTSILSKDDTLRSTDEQRLMCNLLHNYTNAARPVLNTRDALVVYFSVAINQIFDLDDRNQMLTMNVWFEQIWTDEFLQWDPDDYGGLKVINIPSFYVFLPDIELYNQAAEYTKKRMQFRVMLNFNGTVFYGNPAKLVSTCHVDPTFFPFDTQVCHLKFGSWTHSGLEIDLQPSRGAVDLSRLVTNGKWTILNVVQRRNSILYSCCPEPYVDISYYLVLRRQPLYYLLNVYFLAVMLAIMTVAVYQLPIASGEKCALGTALLFSVSVFMLSLSEKLPESSDYIPVIFVYICVVMGMSASSLMITIGIHAVHFQHIKLTPKNKVPQINRVPPWLMHIVRLYRSRRGKWVSGVVKATYNKFIAKKKFVKTLRSYQRSIEFEMKLYHSTQAEVRTILRNYGEKKECLRTSATFPNGSLEVSVVEIRADDRYVAKIIALLNQINYAIERVADSYDAQITRTFNLLEWHELAEALDAIIFWIFLLFNIAVLVLVFGIGSVMTSDIDVLLETFLSKHEDGTAHPQ